MNTSSEAQSPALISRREAIRRVSALLGGFAFVGGNDLLAACEKAGISTDGACGEFTAQDIAYLDEIAETILPATRTPGAKAAKTGAFMALMVTDCYYPAEQKIFREGMHTVDEATRKANDVSFMQATIPQRLAVLTVFDQEQKTVTDARNAAERRRKGLTPLPANTSVAGKNAALPVERKEAVRALGGAVEPAREPAHFFRMMKELTLLGYFTSEIGCTQAMRYVETPGRFDPCIVYTPGQPAWAAHAAHT
jgi:Gluconate 2-dehydrogenase subunit 3